MFYWHIITALLCLKLSLFDAFRPVSTTRISSTRVVNLNYKLCTSYFTSPLTLCATNDEEPYDNTLDALQTINANLKTFLRKIPAPILTAASFLGAVIFMWELSKIAFITAVPLVFILGTLITLTLVGGFFAALALAGLMLFYLPMALSLFAAINISSVLILGFSYVVSTLAVQVLMMDRKQTKSVKGSISTTAVIDVDTISDEMAKLKEFDERLDESRCISRMLKRDLRTVKLDLLRLEHKGEILKEQIPFHQSQVAALIAELNQVQKLDL